MYKKILTAIFSLYVIALFSCASQAEPMPPPVPDKSLFEAEKTIEIKNITETGNNAWDANLPDWLSAFLNGGIKEAERIDSYKNKYLFIASNQGRNFAALNKWVDNYTIEQDFPMLVAVRIEKRMNVSNFMYPEDEYGIFYETLVKNAYGGEYPEAVKEDTYWVKTKAVDYNGDGEQESAALPEEFHYFILISVERAAMQAAVYNLISQAIASSAPSGAQVAAINRLRQNFFEEF